MNLDQARCLFAVLAATAASGVLPVTVPVAAASPLAAVVANDNRQPAGSLSDGTLRLALRAGRGTWHPEGPGGPGLVIEAIGEVDAPLMAPAPLIRVPEGTAIAVSVRNDLATALRVHGFCARDGRPCPPIEVPPAEARSIEFTAGHAGTYHYWATAMGAPIPFRELGGAFVVDPAGADPARDRVLVLTEWSNLTPQQLREVLTADDPGEAFVGLQPGIGFMINGLSWPATERLTHRVGERVRWRVVNLTSQLHPMHLHGFYFEVDSEGNGLRDVAVDRARVQRVVTHLLQPGGTMSLTWIPERVGNWLFHCHLMGHVSPLRRLPGNRVSVDGAPDPVHDHQGAQHAAGEGSLGMAGLVLGVTVRAAEETLPGDRPAEEGPAVQHSANETPALAERAAAPARALTLVMRSRPDAHGGPDVSGFVVREAGTASVEGASSPGPALMLRRGERVEITLVNELPEATAIHWHGIELDSYYDGVHGFSGAGVRTTPMIPPRGSFVVRFTPPRTGTFIYHTHLHDHRQLSAGLYGPLLVVEPGETVDPATDHVLVLGRRGLTSGALVLADESTPVVVNGARSPRFVWATGTRHRLRLVNITPDDILVVALRSSDQGLLPWTPLTKDGAPVPEGARVPVPASQVIAPGETYDFEVALPPGRKTYWVEVRTPAGHWELQAHVVAR